MKKSYFEKMKDPKWQKKRLKILERDGFACVACGETEKTLHVHHKKYYGKNPWSVSDDDLQTLCDTCHKLLGKHPKGGIWWSGHFDGEFGVGIGFCGHCPECGCEMKDKGSFVKCPSCGRTIGWLDPGEES